MTASLPEQSRELLALADALGSIPAPCQSGDAELWFATDPQPAIEACRSGCHGVAECRALAVAQGEKAGVWGAQDFTYQPRARRPA